MKSRAVILPLLLAACGGTPPEPSRPVTEDRSPGAPARATIATDEAPRCEAPALASPLPAALVEKRAAAIDAIDRGRHTEAKQLLEAFLEERPQNAAAAALHQGTTEALLESQKEAATTLDDVQRRIVAMPPTNHVVRHAVPGVERGAGLKLENLSSKPNKVIDDDKWYRENGLAKPSMDISPAKLPGHIPTLLVGNRLRLAIDHGDHRILVYGGHLVTVVAKDGAVVRVLDLGSFLNAGGSDQQIRWAEARDGVLYLSNANMGYARNSNGMNAYLSAIDLATGELMWRSQPLVANSHNFLIHGGHLISGYGFTAEPDFLFVIARDTGEVVQKLPLATKPDVLLAKGGKLFVRGYDKDFELDLPAPTGAPPGPVAGRATPTGKVLSPDSVAQPLEPSADDRCRVAAAIAHLDLATGEAKQEHLDAARSQLWQLSRQYKASRAVGALRQVVDLAQSGRRWLLQIPIATPPKPPSEHARGRRPHPKLPDLPPPPRVQRSSMRNGITDDETWMKQFGKNHPARPLGLDGPGRFRDRGLLGPPIAEVPPALGLSPLSAVLDHGDHVALLYGGRYVAVVAQGRAEALLDLAAFVEPASVRNEEWARFATQEVTWAERADGVLYVCNGGGSYAAEVHGKKGFVSALDPKTGELIWRSEPLVCNANFVLFPRHLVTGYGFTAEPDHLVVLDRTTGDTVSRTPLASAPSVLIRDGQTLHVRTYDTNYELDIQ
ncbi:MAG: hypothetical protein R3B72_43910 [Polyangiaceae bacterium]